MRRAVTRRPRNSRESAAKSVGRRAIGISRGNGSTRRHRRGRYGHACASVRSRRGLRYTGNRIVQREIRQSAHWRGERAGDSADSDNLTFPGNGGRELRDSAECGQIALRPTRESRRRARLHDVRISPGRRQMSISAQAVRRDCRAARKGGSSAGGGAGCAGTIQRPQETRPCGI
jgi:hypothetical protein